MHFSTRKPLASFSECFVRDKLHQALNAEDTRREKRQSLLLLKCTCEFFSFYKNRIWEAPEGAGAKVRAWFAAELRFLMCISPIPTLTWEATIMLLVEQSHSLRQNNPFLEFHLMQVVKFMLLHHIFQVVGPTMPSACSQSAVSKTLFGAFPK